MSVLAWLLSTGLLIMYITCLFTICVFTFKKGYMALGIIGIVFPFLWLIGAILPAKPGSRAQIEDARRWQRQA